MLATELQIPSTGLDFSAKSSSTSVVIWTWSGAKLSPLDKKSTSAFRQAISATLWPHITPRYLRCLIADFVNL